MDVLQHTLEDVRGLDSQVLAKLRVERVRQVGRSQRAREHLPFQLEAQDDVERVGDLVGVHADRARRDAVERAVELVERNGPELFRERLLESRVEEAPGREARPTTFSHSRLCDSWKPDDVPSCSGVRRYRASTWRS